MHSSAERQVVPPAQTLPASSGKSSGSARKPSQLCVPSAAHVRERLVSLRWQLPWRRLQPGNVRFGGANAGLWIKRAMNFLQLVRVVACCLVLELRL